MSKSLSLDDDLNDRERLQYRYRSNIVPGNSCPIFGSIYNQSYVFLGLPDFQIGVGRFH